MGGGAEKIASIVGTELFERNYDVHFLTYYDRTPLYPFKGKYYPLNEKDSNNIIIRELKLLKRAVAIAKYCKKYKIDTAIGFLEEANFPLILSKFFGNKSKLIVSERNNPTLKNLLYKILIKILYPLSDKIIAVSDGVKKILIEEFKLSNVERIYNIQNIEHFKFQEKKRIEKRDLEIMYDDSFKFINIGRLSQQKGQIILIKALKDVTEQFPNTKLIILGEGKLRKKLMRTIQKLHLEDNVFLLGNKKNVFPYLREADCFVFSS